MLAAGAGQRKGQARPVRVVTGPGNALAPTAEGGSAGGRRLGTGPRKARHAHQGCRRAFCGLGGFPLTLPWIG